MLALLYPADKKIPTTPLGVYRRARQNALFAIVQFRVLYTITRTHTSDRLFTCARLDRCLDTIKLRKRTARYHAIP